MGFCSKRISSTFILFCIASLTSSSPRPPLPIPNIHPLLSGSSLSIFLAPSPFVLYFYIYEIKHDVLVLFCSTRYLQVLFISYKQHDSIILMT